MIRVAIADDQELVRAGFKMILEAQADIAVVAEAADGDAVVRAVRESAPDVVLMDIRMPGTDGLAATRTITREGPRPAVLVLTTFDTEQYVYEALRSGASGFLLKTAPPQRLVEAVRLIDAGEALLGPTITRRLIETYVRRSRPGHTVPPGMDTLTQREREVLVLVGRGRSNSEIAAELFVSEATVKTHINRLFAKLALRDRVQAVVLAYETGLVEPGDARPGTAPHRGVGRQEPG